MNEPDHTAETIDVNSSTIAFDPEGQLIGSMIGPYKLLEAVGEGGFGVVFLAEQIEPVRRRVALKLIKLGMDTKHVIARFQAERQALAIMDHPHVARVFDAGATDDGRPYFVMEYVAGIPITEHCDLQRLGIKQRLRLFIQACEAVQHAHQKGIIHRDLKPSNVLVSVKGGVSEVKVIDFGVAKALHQKLTEKTLFTEHGELIGTPEYMSPEQAEMSVQDIDTRSDIYALGLLLYNLLTGTLPFDPEPLRRAGFGEIQRIIREEEPPRPSTKLSSLGGDSTAIAVKRQLDTPSLLRELRGDLDWIIMKALEKDRERRYETAVGLARDIERHLNDDPVLAGPPSATYRMGKFVRKHRRGVIAACGVLGVLVLAIAGTTWGWLEAIDARDAESRAKAEAEIEQRIAKAINEFLTDDLLAAVAPSAASGKGRDVLMRDVLDQAAKRIEDASSTGGRFEGMPLVEASIHRTLGKTYRLLGDYPGAERHLQRARSLRRRELGAEHPDTLASTNNLANLYENQGRYDEAEVLYSTTLQIRKRVLGEEHPHTLLTTSNLALLYKSQRRYDDAESLLVTTIRTLKQVLGETHPDTLGPIGNLASLYRQQYRYEEAEPLYATMLQIMRQARGEEHPDTLAATNNLANLYLDQNRYDEAEPLYVRTLEIRKRILGDEHQSTLFSMMNLAALYFEQHRFDEAEAFQAQASAASYRVWPKGAWFIGTFRGEHGRTLLKLDQYQSAEAALAEAHEILTSALGSADPRTVSVVELLDDLYAAWHEAESDKGYDAKAAEWRAKLKPAEASPK